MRELILAFILLMFFSCSGTGEVKSQKSGGQENVFREDVKVHIIDGKDTLATFKTEVAADEYKRETGLMYRKQMDDDRAMLFVFEDEDVRFFYMKNTYIPLDIIYIGSDSTIVSIAKRANPLDETPLSSYYPARFVLEIKGGLGDRLGIHKGNKISIEKR